MHTIIGIRWNAENRGSHQITKSMIDTQCTNHTLPKSSQIPKTIMSRIVNHRRRAAQQGERIQTSRCSPTAYSHLRQKVSLTPQEKKRLEQFQTRSGRTSQEVYTVFECELVFAKNRASVECDTIPPLKAVGINGLDERKNGFFYLPAFPGYRWESHMYPTFDASLLSSVRFPQYGADNTVIPNYSDTRAISLTDKFDIYASLLHHTIMDYIRSPSAHKARVAWQVLRTWLHYMKARPQDPLDKEEEKIFIQSLENRDGSYESACTYKKWREDHHPSQVYAIMLRLMQEHPELVHKSRLPHPWFLIWGQWSLKADETKEDATGFLRLFLERGLGTQNLPGKPRGVTNKEELVQWCHEHMSDKLQRALKHATVAMEVWRAIKKNPMALGPSNFQRILETIEQRVNPLDGILPYCLLLDPSSTLTNDTLAEIWWSAASNSSKSSILARTSLQGVGTPLLNQVLSDIHHAMASAQEEVKMTTTQAVVSDADILSQMQQHVNQASPHNCFCALGMEAMAKFICSLIKQGVTISTLYYLASHQTYLSERRFLTLVCRACPPHHPFLSLITSGEQRRTSMNEGYTWMNLFFRYRYGHVDVKLIQQVEEESYVTFVPFERAREWAQQVAESLGDIHMSFECPICFEEFPLHQLVALHKDERHGVCPSCRVMVDKCPFCRVEL